MASDIVTGGAVVAGIIAILVVLRPYILKKPALHQARSDSGDQDVSFWMAEFQDVKDKIQIVKEAVTKGDIDRASIEASVEAVQHTVDRIEQKINSRRR